MLSNLGVQKILEIENERGAELQISDILEQAASVYPKVMVDGEMDASAWSCGMVAGLIHDVPSVEELVTRLMDEAHALITKRLSGMLGA